MAGNMVQVEKLIEEDGCALDIKCCQCGSEASIEEWDIAGFWRFLTMHLGRHRESRFVGAAWRDGQKMAIFDFRARAYLIPTGNESQV